MRKKLPIGIQTFKIIREENYYYVDKTMFIEKLLTEGSHYFLSRPRRFGKSLFLDTLKDLFEGKKSLFEGLYIYDKWDWSVKYPVIKLSFGGGVIRDAADLERRLQDWITSTKSQITGDYESKTVSGCFYELIRKLFNQTGQRVVILIDEYDKPILDRIEEPEKAREIRDALKDIYSVIKDSDKYIKFVFLTGVSKFSKVSLFSGLNNLKDITVDSRYSSICGYSDEDVDTVFAPELEGLDRDKIRLWYNGYNWTGTAVYNPFDLLLLFDKREFLSYWFETGTPTFLVKLLSDRQTWVPELGKIETSATILSTFDVGNIPTEALMFQAGYLTFDTVNEVGSERFVTMRYPNLEVQQALNGSLLGVMSNSQNEDVRYRYKLYLLLQKNDFPAMKELFHSFFASIPHDWYRKNQLAGYEGYYASIFYSYFAALGLEITVEDSTNKGRIDMTVRFNGNIYIFEFKVVELTPEGKAIEQLKAKGYAEKYRQFKEPIHLIGVEFNKDDRNIVGFDVESL